MKALFSLYQSEIETCIKIVHINTTLRNNQSYGWFDEEDIVNDQNIPIENLSTPWHHHFWTLTRKNSGETTLTCDRCSILDNKINEFFNRCEPRRAKRG